MHPPTLLLLASLIGVAVAQTPTNAEKVSAASYEGRVVGRIDYDPTDQPLPRAELDKLVPVHPGEKLKLSDVHTAIQNLYQTGRFSNISISAFNEGTTLVLNISTELAYFVGQITLRGVEEPPNHGQLLTASKLELGTPFEDNDMEQAVQNMVERMRANGFHDAKIDYNLDRHPATEEAAIRFDIHPGNRARFDGVTLTGKCLKPQESIVKATHWRRGLLFLTLPGWRYATESLVNSGVASVRQDFQKGDHLEAQVTLEKMDYHAATNTVTPSIAIENGPIVKVLTEGAKVSRRKLRQLIPVFQERTVDRTLLVEGQRNLVEYFQSQGYFDAQVNFNDERPSADAYEIDYDIQRNQRYKLVRVELTGNKYFGSSTLRERMLLTPASFPRFRYGKYSQKLLDRDKDTLKDLYRANGFRDADIDSNVDTNYHGKNGEIGVRSIRSRRVELPKYLFPVSSTRTSL